MDFLASIFLIFGYLLKQQESAAQETHLVAVLSVGIG